MKTITLPTSYMLKTYMDFLLNLAFEEGLDDSYLKILRVISSEKMENIRQLFIDGYTMMLLGQLGEILETEALQPPDGMQREEAEIRILNNKGKLIGVIIDSEINY